MESLEWGYNRDKEKLPQINVGMYSAYHENNCRLLNPPTKIQRDIMECLNLSPSSFGCV